ncbi:MAG: TonB-dependent receptor [Fulvivirga sp.]|uniref:TonB-dependent receptor n=1 Tax=Fulvivirga sp. TaxID=1931237 RepID=UPI0032EDA9E4
MRYYFLLFFIPLHSFAFSQTGACDLTVSGQILSVETNEPLPFATIRVLKTDLGAIADENGHFVIEKICDDEIDLEVRFLGYKTIVHHHDFHHGNPTIFLAPNETVLESIIIEDQKIDEIRSLSVQRKELDKVDATISSIGQLSADISGVSLLQTGTNISKPIIHGLHSNRVLVINDGVRHAYQVWGEEHAPEIDPSHVDRIEVVKGAATVKYGPDALGGVILYNSKKPAFDKELGGSIGTSYQTNGRAISSQFNLSQGAHRFAWDVGVFGIYQGDLSAPNYTLSNTGRKELGASFHTFLHRKRFDLQISGNYFQQELGILRASVVGNQEDLEDAINDATPETTFPFTYDIGSPGQETEHGLLKADLSVFLGEHTFNIQYAIQRNIRKEFDVRRGDLNERPVIDLELLSHTVDTEWLQPTKGRWNGSSGFQVFTQNSTNEPESNPANFVPDYKVLNLGVFTVQSLDFENTILELGARLDFQNLSVSDEIRETFSYTNELEFVNPTFTLGIRKMINNQVTVFSNIGSAWRPPNVAELYSFGLHQSRLQFGFWRYDLDPNIVTPADSVFDQTLRQVPAEQGIKWISGLEIVKSKTTAEFIVFANRINNFIFLRPYGVTTNIRGPDFPFFIFDQTDALFIGTDWDIRHSHTDFLSSELKVSYVYAQSIERGQPLIEIPPLNIDYTFRQKVGVWNYGINLSYTASQWNEPLVIAPTRLGEADNPVDRNTDIFDFMEVPDSFFLLGAEAGFDINKWSGKIRVNNLLNTEYRQYTDKLRYFANAPGRNISFSVQFTF